MTRNRKLLAIDAIVVFFRSEGPRLEAADYAFQSALRAAMRRFIKKRDHGLD
jgi:hypothetical protein